MEENTNNIEIIFLNTTYRIDKSWKNFFESLKPELNEIEEKLNSETELKPSLNLIFKVFETSINNINVVLLGQDPYPNDDNATGIAFELNNYNSWECKTKNTSLINILKELYREKNSLKKATNIETIRLMIKNKSFKIFKPNLLFKEWVNNGVFLLNTSLTCKKNSPNSHKKIWSFFMEKLICEIAKNKNTIHWLLCGNEARKYKKLIPIIENNIIMESKHPSTREFIGSGVFKQVIESYCKTE